MQPSSPTLHHTIHNMFYFSYNLFLLMGTLISSATITVSTRHGVTPPTVTRLTDLFPHVPYDKAFSSFFGGSNVQRVDNGSVVNIALNKTSGSGFKSRETYHYGFFSAAIKLPSDYSAGVVVAFYMSNADAFPKSHDEIDLELLGHEKRKEWALQTNVYGNGSVGTGREEKFHLWFDPTADFHQYSILWNPHHIVFLVDNVPVREVNRTQAMSRAYPSKPMSAYATIWDGSEWATHGGKKPVDYGFAPFVASFRDMEVGGSSSGKGTGRLSIDPVDGAEFATLSGQQKAGLDWSRSKFMFYSYCQDTHRFPVMPPECKSNL